MSIYERVHVSEHMYEQVERAAVSRQACQFLCVNVWVCPGVFRGRGACSWLPLLLGLSCKRLSHGWWGLSITSARPRIEAPGMVGVAQLSEVAAVSCRWPGWHGARAGYPLA